MCDESEHTKVIVKELIKYFDEKLEEEFRRSERLDSDLVDLQIEFDKIKPKKEKIKRNAKSK